MPAPVLTSPPPIADSDLAFLSRWTREKDLEVLKRHAEDNWREMVEGATHIYRCMRRATYLSPRIARYPVYEEMLACKGERKRFMEVGCAFGTDVRKVLADGWPTENILAVDITDNYWKLGLSLFKDAATPPAVHTLFGDLTDDSLYTPGATPSIPSRPDLAPFLDAGTHFIYAGAVLHVLTESGVRALLTKLYAALAPGGALFGLSVGVSEPDAGSKVTPPVPWVTASTPSTITTATARRVLHSSTSLTTLATSIGFASVKVKCFNIPRDVEERVMGQTTEEEEGERRVLKERYGVERLYLGFEMRK